MNIKQLVSYILLLLSVNLFAQKKITKGEINYEVMMQIDEGKLREMSEKKNESSYAKSQVVSIFKNQKKSTYELIFNNFESIYRIKKELNISEGKLNLVRILAGKGTFYTNKKEMLIENQKNAFGELFLIELPKGDWVLTNEEKKIGKYKCYKAITERKGVNKRGEFVNKTIAWYTPELPINFGPKDYYGLPGLILELKEGNVVYRATKISIMSKEKIKVEKPTKGKKITLNNYNKMIKELVEQKY
ncbi:GLPGLI family protein [Tenacibaculum sp. AHE15PA]|uniref:GLPGLI family protein n=1 Tax=unclassified Tenacibaculum TaxID=2635139 RepID=UPI001C4EDEC4|nr:MULTISPECIES: GLPGLI family protein [unclassified Tenacibaculum]QXP72994.1 GLPGLI family protein [Tenacibaculum sp. AHE14PA]QXP76908.1 GLPGLI family protein [Tenacibaculum sp. AHE15PA]